VYIYVQNKSKREKVHVSNYKEKLLKNNI
jgi:hypothetical protein